MGWSMGRFMQPDLSLVFSNHRSELRSYLQHRLGDGPMARNLLTNHRKQEARRRTDPVAPDAFAQIAADQPSPEDAADSRLQLERLHALVQELPRRTQEIFVLNRIEGLTHAEVARELSICESSVQKHLALAIAHLTHRLRAR